MLIVFSGLPGTGKTTLARAIAAERGATWLRIDAIEQALRASGALAGGVGPAGYMVGYALAEANLRLGQAVVADSVNPLGITRAAWRAVAARAGVPCLEIELVCADATEHRRRVENREADLPNHVLPRWEEVVRHDYEPWNTPCLRIDTAGRSVPDALQVLRDTIAAG
ncbi:AAA family ATPase [Roseomonas harenae]|jgi:predicted kinase|uniref:AAA family ATPase n=1 Tax=Muricoccus harenae TaxID=2692566 RepID=UPI001331BC78|nr:AAA family ATPase [Roseomonas harenae]